MASSLTTLGGLAETGLAAKEAARTKRHRERRSFPGQGIGFLDDRCRTRRQIQKR
jgi:hypothetical protein